MSKPKYDPYNPITGQEQGVVVRINSENELHEQAQTEDTSPHWYTCTHLMDRCELVKEAEQIAVFHDPHSHVTHISVRDQGWFCCKVFPCKYYEALTPDQEMVIIRGIMSDLRLLRE